MPDKESCRLGFPVAPASAPEATAPANERDRGFADPRLPHGSGFCLCVACGRYFRSDKGFMAHRRAGRCLTVAEMRAKGMVENAKGYWVTEAYDREAA